MKFGVWFFVLFLVVGSFFPNPIRAESVEITITNIKEIKGNLMVGVFDTKEDFKVTPLPISKKFAVADTGEMKVTLNGFTANKRYAVIIYQDLNLDKDLNFKRLGIPSEPITFSNLPKIVLGPPSFRKSSFLVPPSGTKITVKLLHL